MNYASEIRTIWVSLGELIISVGEVRDVFLLIPGEEARFMELDEARNNLAEVQTTLFEYLEQKAPIFGKKPDLTVYTLAAAAVSNSKTLLEIASNEAQLKEVSPDGKLTFEQNMLLLKSQVNDPKMPAERKAKAERLLKIGFGVKRNKLLKSVEAKANNAPNK